ncbi:hypothetical protein D3C75_1071570 [compost metagenome]
MGIAQEQGLQMQHLADVDRGPQPIATEPQGAQIAHAGEFFQRVLGQRYLIAVQPQVLKVGHVRQHFRQSCELIAVQLQADKAFERFEEIREFITGLHVHDRKAAHMGDILLGQGR